MVNYIENYINIEDTFFPIRKEMENIKSMFVDNKKNNTLSEAKTYFAKLSYNLFKKLYIALFNSLSHLTQVDKPF